MSRMEMVDTVAPGPVDPTDHSLVARSMSGDADAFNLLVERYYSRVYAVAHARLRNADTAEDVAQEAFLRAFIHVKALQHPERFAPWLIQITRNLALNWSRNARRAGKAVSMVSLHEDGTDFPDRHSQSVRERLLQDEEAAHLRDALYRLSPDLREVVLLHFVEGLNKSEIGRLLGVHDSSVGRRIDRGLHLLRNELTSTVTASLRSLKPESRDLTRVTSVIVAFSLLDAGAKAAIAGQVGLPAASRVGDWFTVSKLLSFSTTTGAVMSKTKLITGIAAGAVIACTGGWYAAHQYTTVKPPTSQKQRTLPGRSASDVDSAERSAASRRAGSQQHDSADARNAAPQSNPVLRGTVLDETGKPVRDAVIAYRIENSSVPQETSSTAAGHFRFEMPQFAAGTLMVDSGRHIPYREEVTSATEALTIRLVSARASIEGHVFRYGSGGGVSGVTVIAVPGDHKANSATYLRLRKSVTNDLGAFKIESLGAGSHMLIARSDSLGPVPGENGGRALISLQPVEAASGIKLLVYPGHTIRGTVYDAVTSEPIAAAGVANSAPAIPVGKNSTVTDDSGRYRLTGIFTSEMKAVVEATAKGFAVNEIQVPISMSQLELKQDILMARRASVSGTVRTFDGKPIPDAQIHLVHARQQRIPAPEPDAVSDSKGRYELTVSPRTKLRIQATVHGMTSGFSPEFQTEREDLNDVDIYLAGTATLAGVVSDPQGKPVPQARIQLMETVWLASQGRSEPIASIDTDEQGRYRISQAPAYGGPSPAKGNLKSPLTIDTPELTVSAAGKGYASSKSEKIVLKPGEHKELNLQLQTAHFLAGRVLDKAGKALPRVHLAAYRTSSGGTAHSALTDEEGRFRFDQLAGGEHNISVFSSIHGARTYEKVAIDRDDAVFRLGEDQITFVGTVVDWKTGQPIREFTAESPNGIRISYDQTNTGRFTAEGLNHRNWYKVTITAEEGTARHSFTAENLTGNIEHTFRVGPGGDVRGRVVEKGTLTPLGDVLVEVKNRDIPYGAAEIPAAVTRTDADGVFRFEKLRDGDQTIIVRPEKPLVPRTERFVVEHGEEKDLQDIEVGTGGSVKVTVRLGGTDTPVPDVKVELIHTTPRSMKHVLSTGPDGIALFEGLEGDLNFTANLPDHNTNSSFNVAPNQRREVNFRIGDGKLVARLVKDGKPVSAPVTLVRTGQGPRITLKATADADGVAVFEKVAPGGWEVTIAAGRTVNEWADIRPNGITEVTYTIPSSQITGRVVDAEGNPVGGADVKAAPVTSVRANDIFTPNRGVAQTSRDDGSFILEGLEATAHNVSAVIGDRRSETVRVEFPPVGSVAPLTLQLNPAAGGTLISTALNMQDGTAMTSPWCVIKGENGPFNHASRRNGSGVMKITGIPPGEYQVQVSTLGYSCSERTVQIRAGEETRIDDVLYPAGSIRWVLKNAAGEPLEGVECALTPNDPASMEKVRSGKTDALGIWATRGLFGGSYTATGKWNGQIQTQTFTIPPRGHDEKQSAFN